ncbi:hypothetical protein OKW38_007077 [Paraburkholderia sp. MM5496-R1]
MRDKRVQQHLMANDACESIARGKRSALLLVIAQCGREKRGVAASARLQKIGDALNHGQHLLARFVRVGSGRVGSGRVGSGRVGSGRVGRHMIYLMDARDNICRHNMQNE